MEALQNQIREKLQSDARWRQLQEDSNKSVCLSSTHLLLAFTSAYSLFCWVPGTVFVGGGIFHACICPAFK
jgi:hypothetical protein